MAILEILKDTAVPLKKVAKRVNEVDENVLKLVADMTETLKDARGLGLAGNQVGVLRRVIIVQFNDGFRPYLNPKIVKWSKRTECHDEGCLSFPNIYGEVERDLCITVEAQDIELNKQRFTVEGLGARIFQHEIDHLNGITFIKRAKPDTIREVIPDDFDEDDDYEDDDIDEEYLPKSPVTEIIKAK